MPISHYSTHINTAHASRTCCKNPPCLCCNCTPPVHSPHRSQASSTGQSLAHGQINQLWALLVDHNSRNSHSWAVNCFDLQYVMTLSLFMETIKLTNKSNVDYCWNSATSPSWTTPTVRSFLCFVLYERYLSAPFSYSPWYIHAQFSIVAIVGP